MMNPRSGILVALCVAGLSACAKKDDDKTTTPTVTPATNPTPTPDPTPTPTVDKPVEKPAEEKPVEQKPATPQRAVYKRDKTPQKLTFKLPTALFKKQAKKLRDGAEDPMPAEDDVIFAPGEDYPDPSEEAPPLEAGTADAPHGLDDLQYVIDSFVMPNQQQLDNDLLLLDELLANNDCAKGCELADVKVKLTEEMVNALEGPDEADEAKISDEEEKALIGLEIPVGKVVVVQQPDDPDYTTLVTVTGEGHDATFAWNADFSKLLATETEHGIETPAAPDARARLLKRHRHRGARARAQSPDGDMAFSRTMSWAFEDKKTFAMSEDGTYGAYNYSTTFYAAPDSEQEGAFAISSTQSRTDESGDDSRDEISAYFTEAKGFVKSEHSYFDKTTTLTVDGTLPENEYLSVFAEGTTAADLPFDGDRYNKEAFGTISTDEHGAIASADWNAPVEAGNYPIFKLVFPTPDENGEVTGDPKVELVPDTAVTGIAVTKSRHVSGYEELVGTDGETTGFCFFDSGDFGGTSVCHGVEEADLEADPIYASYSAEAGEDGTIDQLGSEYVSLAGGTLALTGGQSLLLFPTADAAAAYNTALASETPDDDDAAYASIAGECDFVGDDSTATDTPLAEAYSCELYADADEVDLSHAVAALPVFPEDEASPYQVHDLTGDGVTVSVTEITADNADSVGDDLGPDGDDDDDDDDDSHHAPKHVHHAPKHVHHAVPHVRARPAHGAARAHH